MTIRHFIIITLFIPHISFSSSKQIAQSLSYRGTDPAEVLYTLYLASRPIFTSEDIVTALQVDLDSITLDFFRIELINHSYTLPNGKTCATINNLWGNAINITFDISSQALVLSNSTPFSLEWIKETLQTLKSNIEASEETYEQREACLYKTWITPLAYTKQIIYHWFSEDTLPLYEEKEQDYILSSILKGTYNPNDTHARNNALRALSTDQIKALSNEIQARELYKRGNMHLDTSQKAITTPLRETAKKVSAIAQTAAIERILHGKPNKELERELNALERTLLHQRQQEEYLLFEANHRNETRGTSLTFTMKRSAY